MTPSDDDKEPNSRDGSIPFPVRLIATGFFSGYFPWASGTAGSLVGLAILLLLPWMQNPAILGIAIVVTFGIGVVTSARVARAVGNRLSASAQLAKKSFQGDNKHADDPSMVVIDEIVGLWITFLFIPLSIASILLGFVAFRAMDILKPEPCRFVERYQSGWGIMLDDVVAGIYAHIITRLAILTLPSVFAP